LSFFVIFKKLIDTGFNKLDLKSISADTVDGNISSTKVLEKLGFTPEDDFVKDGILFHFYKKYK